MKKKTIALLLVLMMVFGVSVGGTIAYLTSTDSVTNTFTVGNVTITLAESLVTPYGELAKYEGEGNDKKIVALTEEEMDAEGFVQETVDDGNTYKLIPGHTYTKDPTITVSEGSEDCWVMVEVVNGLEGIASYTLNDGWAIIDEDSKVPDGSKVYVYNAALSAEETATPFSKFTVAEDYKGSAEDNGKTIIVKAYAVQKDTFADATAAWDATFGA